MSCLFGPLQQISEHDSSVQHEHPSCTTQSSSAAVLCTALQLSDRAAADLHACCAAAYALVARCHRKPARVGGVSSTLLDCSSSHALICEAHTRSHGLNLQLRFHQQRLHAAPARSRPSSVVVAQLYLVVCMSQAESLWPKRLPLGRSRALGLMLRRCCSTADRGRC